jgi:dipeptidyl aminopeptidase/acylaminoacyl peptidase
LPTGHVLFWRAGSVWAAPFDLERLAISGDAVPIVNDVRIHGAGAAAYAVSTAGALAYIPAVAAPQRTLVWVDRRGAETPIEASPGPYVSPRLSPDGQRILLAYRSDATEDIWLHDVGRRVTEPFIARPESEWEAAWTGDGERVLFSSRQTGRFHVYATRANGLGQPEPLTDGVSAIFGGTPDGRGVLIPRQKQLVVVALADGQASALWPQEGEGLGAQFSPDGRWIAYAAVDTGGQHQIWVRPYPDVDSNRWRLSADGGQFPRWSSDGRTVFYRRGTSMMAVSVRAGDAFAFDAPVRLFDGPYLPDYDLARDGRFLMIREPADSPVAYRIVVVLNWTEELRARMAGLK